MPTTQKLNEDLVFILERQNTILESKKTDSDDYVLEGTAAVFGKENNNNRIYEEAEYLPHLNYLKDKIALETQNQIIEKMIRKAVNLYIDMYLILSRREF